MPLAASRASSVTRPMPKSVSTAWGAFRVASSISTLRRLDVLVQHADRVRRRQRRRHLGDDLEPIRERHLADPALRLRPSPPGCRPRRGRTRRSRAPRRGSSRGSRAMSSRSPSSSLSSRKRVISRCSESQPLGVVAELEDPLVAGLLVLGQPDLAEAALAELLLHAPSAGGGESRGPAPAASRGSSPRRPPGSPSPSSAGAASGATPSTPTSKTSTGSSTPLKR